MLVFAGRGKHAQMLFENVLKVGFVPSTMKRKSEQLARMRGTLWLVVFNFRDLQVGGFPWQSMLLSPANPNARSMIATD
jgi:hypothetical protein